MFTVEDREPMSVYGQRGPEEAMKAFIKGLRFQAVEAMIFSGVPLDVVKKTVRAIERIHGGYGL